MEKCGKNDLCWRETILEHNGKIEIKLWKSRWGFVIIGVVRRSEGFYARSLEEGAW